VKGKADLGAARRDRGRRKARRGGVEIGFGCRGVR
jgi:hypothetical protein